MSFRYHGKERRKETSHINASLMALKECIRAKAMGTSQSHQHVFRKSKLTMALKNSFNLPHARTIVIATVSPASKDTEHSLNTLRHACIMHGQENEEGGGSGDKETRFVTGGKITTEEIGEINIARIAKRNFEKKKSNNGALDELKTNNGNQVETKLAKAANKEIEITDKMKRKMRRLSENKSFVTLDESIQRLLKTSRERLGKEERQFARLQVASGNSGSVNNPDYESLQRIVEEERNETKINEHDSSEDEGVQDDVDHSHSKKQQQQPFSRNSLDQDFAALYEDDFENLTPRSASNHGDVKPSIAHKPVGGSTGKSNSQYSRVPFEKIFECIFIAKDSVPLSILLMQLRAMLKVHHYSTEEIEHFINKEVKGKGSAMSSSTPQKNNARPTTPRRPATPQRPLSASRSGSSSSINQVNDRSRSNSHTHSQPNNKTPNRRMSNGSNLSNYAHGKSTMADSDNETYSSANDNSSVSRSHRPQVGISKMSSADREKEEKMLHAKQQLELEAQQRKQRQEAARQFRQEQEQHKVNQIITKTGINPNNNNNNAKRQQMMLMLQKKSFEEENERRIQKEIEEHQQEIHRLNQLIEIDRTAKTTDEKLSMAQKFGVKKQLALHKAAILKAERKKASLGENLSVVSVAGGGGGGSGAGGSSGYDDEPSPSEMRRSLSRDSVAGHQNNRPVVDFDDMVVPTHSRSAGGVNGGNAEKKSIRTEGSGSSGNGNGSGNNMRFYGASGGGEGVKKRPEWNFDVPSDSAFSSDSIAEHNTADAGKDSDDLPLISERGRPLSMRMAQQMAKRNPPQY